MNSSQNPAVKNVIQARGLGIAFGEWPNMTEAVHGLDLSVAEGEFVSILGPSGCGKSTFLSALAGLIAPTQGQLLVDAGEERGAGHGCGVVFQHPTLYPWKNVFANVEIGLKNRNFTRAERAQAVERILEQVGLQDFARHYPAQLSGGMQQRVNLARGLVNRPAVLLMDEPFAALDAQTRLEMQELLLEIWSGQRMTVVFVTHDVDEAIFLADRVIVLTRRPAQVRAEFRVDLERPRTTAALTESVFVHLKKQSLDLLRSEIGRTPKKGASPSDELPAALDGSVQEPASVA